MFCRASVAVWSSSRGGALSMASSVMLKSPITRCGRAMLCLRLSFSIVCQNCGWAALFTGAYMFRIDISQPSSHLILRRRARPGTSLCVVTFSGLMSALFITKATPALDVGEVGSSDTIMLRFLLKHSLTWSVICWFIWVSWIANMAILCSYSVLLISLHLLRRGTSRDVAPLMFKVAMFMFAFFSCFTLVSGRALFSPGMGGRGYSLGLAWRGRGFTLPLGGRIGGGCMRLWRCIRPWLLAGAALLGAGIISDGGARAFLLGVYILLSSGTVPVIEGLCYLRVSFRRSFVRVEAGNVLVLG